MRFLHTSRALALDCLSRQIIGRHWCNKIYWSLNGAFHPMMNDDDRIRQDSRHTHLLQSVVFYSVRTAHGECEKGEILFVYRLQSDRNLGREVSVSAFSSSSSVFCFLTFLLLLSLTRIRPGIWHQTPSQFYLLLKELRTRGSRI